MAEKLGGVPLDDLGQVRRQDGRGIDNRVAEALRDARPAVRSIPLPADGASGVAPYRKQSF